MSMKTYPVNDYGIVLTKKELCYIAQLAEDENRDGPEDDIEFDLCEAAEYAEAEIISDFQGEAYLVIETGMENENDSITFGTDDTIYYLSLPRGSTLFKAAYSNMDELVEAMKESYGDFLPDDFDFRNNIRHIVGTTFG